jgi:hypothetical protein
LRDAERARRGDRLAAGWTDHHPAAPLVAFAEAGAGFMDVSDRGARGAKAEALALAWRRGCDVSAGAVIVLIAVCT